MKMKSFRVDEEFNTRAKEIANKYGISGSDAIRLAVKQFHERLFKPRKRTYTPRKPHLQVPSTSETVE